MLPKISRGKQEEVQSSTRGRTNYCKSISAFGAGGSFIFVKPKDLWPFFILIIKKDSNEANCFLQLTLKMSFRCCSQNLDITQNPNYSAVFST